MLLLSFSQIRLVQSILGKLKSPIKIVLLEALCTISNTLSQFSLLQFGGQYTKTIFTNELLVEILKLTYWLKSFCLSQDKLSSLSFEKTKRPPPMPLLVSFLSHLSHLQYYIHLILKHYY